MHVLHALHTAKQRQQPRRRHVLSQQPAGEQRLQRALRAGLDLGKGIPRRRLERRRIPLVRSFFETVQELAALG